MMNRLRKAWKDYASEKHILIYEMGGVNALQYANAIKGTLHFNTLYNNNPCYVITKQQRNSLSKKIRGALHDSIKRMAVKSRKHIKIITFVREPHSRNIASYFYDFGYWMYDYSCKTREDQRSHSSVEIVIAAFNKLFNRYYVLEWFEREFKRFTGIDIYQYQFDKEKGWSVIKQGKYEILILQYEKLNDADSVINAFANTAMDLSDHKINSSKWYDDILKQFIDIYMPSSDYVDKLYTSKYATHFYTQAQLEYFKNAIKKRSL